MPHTERGRFRFVVKQYANGQPFIVLEPMSGSLSVLEKPFRLLALDLQPGTSFDEAEKLADLLDEKVPSVGLTHFDN